MKLWNKILLVLAVVVLIGTIAVLINVRAETKLTDDTIKELAKDLAELHNLVTSLPPAETGLTDDTIKELAKDLAELSRLFEDLRKEYEKMTPEEKIESCKKFVESAERAGIPVTGRCD